MSRPALPFRTAALAAGRPYAERQEEEAGWHDRVALGLQRLAAAPLQRALGGFDAEMRSVATLAQARSETLRRLADGALRERARSVRARLRREGFALGVVAECFALVRAAAERSLGQRHFETQLMGGYALLRGRLVEMATGEGKTFCATLPACTVAFAGYPVHVITVNDYLAARDAERMGPLYAILGLGVGVVRQGLDKPARRAAYAQAITYATNKELAFDYLRDRVALASHASRLHQSLRRLGGQGAAADGPVLRGLYCAIVDEADSVFVDEARTPLILSATADAGEEAAHGAAALAFARALAEGEDFHVRALERAVTLTGPALERLDAFAEGRDGPWSSQRAREELVRQALAALHLYHRDQHYVLAGDKVQIVDESTGRVMPDRSWERGLHQMIEVKEGVPPTARRDTLARLTYQRLFRRYVHLSGMTGTAAEAAPEIRAVYGIALARVPLHRPSRRGVLPATFCATQEEKWRRVADAAARLVGQGRPVLIGTRSVAASERLSAVLRERGWPHALLNAKQDADEAHIVAEAGQRGRITVATNMAGRGTDIPLGAGVAALGGLHVILTEYHESRRIDRQLMGRCARQGDPGSCEAIVSLEDEIFATYAPRATALLRRRLQAGWRVPAPAYQLLRRLAQRAAERRHASVRMQNLHHDRQLQRVLAFTGRGE